MHAALLAVALLAQRTESFTVSLDAAVADAAPLFGPVRDAEWAAAQTPHWQAAINGAIARSRLRQPDPDERQ